MDRLTFEESYCSFTECDLKDRCGIERACYDKRLYDKLKEYEDLEEQGKLLKLPCKIGSLVYEIKKDLNSMKRETIEHNGHYYHRNIDIYFITQVTFEIEDISSLGKTVFLTKAEAEAALETMKGESND